MPLRCFVFSNIARDFVLLRVFVWAGSTAWCCRAGHLGLKQCRRCYCVHPCANQSAQHDDHLWMGPSFFAGLRAKTGCLLFLVLFLSEVSDSSYC